METENSSLNAKPKKSLREMLWRWIWVVIFAMAFAWVESAIVVYLREIYYEGSFSFPVIVIWADGKYVLDKLLRIELGREVATIIMLLAVGWAAGKNRLQKFSFFMIAFGVWDIFYYVWLRVMLGWPESVMTWDLLFCIPLPWTGPVITPVLIALTLVAAGSLVIYYDEKFFSIQFCWYDWVIESICGILIIVSFCWDWKNIMQVPDGVIRSGIPNPFAWWLYGPAFIFSVIYFSVRLKQIVSSRKKQFMDADGP